MTVRARADQANVHWLTENTQGEILGRNTGILYIPKWTKTKLGQVTRDTAEGLTPQQAFVTRYAGATSSSEQDIIAQDLFVFTKTKGENFDYDDGIRQLIHHLYKQGQIPFDALHPQHQLPNMNSETLVGYDREQHFPILLNVIKQYFGLGQFYDTKTPITWRWGQDEEIQDICARLQKHKLCLYAAFTGRGKTKIAVEVASRVVPQGGLVLVTTPITDTKQGFADDINTTHFGPTRERLTTFMDGAEFRRHTIDALRARADAGELIFVVLTVQDLRWGESVDSLDLAILRDRYAKLKGNLKLWIRDERHSQYNGLITSSRLSQLSAEMELDLTATPYNCFDLYDRKHIVSRTLLWGLLNRPHTRLPDIGIDALSMAACEVSPRIQQLYSTIEGYDPRKLFARDGENFLLEAELTSLATLFYTSNLSRKKNPLSINNDTELSPAAKLCGMWVLPAGRDGDGASEYIPTLAELLNTRVGQRIQWTDSYTLERECPTGVSIGTYVENLIQANGKSLVILTCGKFLTGTNIPSMGHVVLFDKMNSIANFEQLMGRTIREYQGKDRVKLYCLAPGAQLRVTMGRMALKSSELSGGDPQALLDCVPLTEYSGGTWNRLTSTEVLSSVQEWFREQVRKLIPGVSVLRSIADADLSVWKGVDLSNLKMMLPKSRLNEDIGSKVREKGSKGSEVKQERETGVPEDKILELIQNVVFEAQWVGYSMMTSDWERILQSPAIVGMFGEGVVTAFTKTLQDTPRLEALVREHLQTKQQAYSNLPYTEVYDELFGNSKLKQSIGLVYVPLELARELVANLQKKSIIA